MLVIDEPLTVEEILQPTTGDDNKQGLHNEVSSHVMEENGVDDISLVIRTWGEWKYMVSAYSYLCVDG